MNKKTVFIIGAGASEEVKLPTGYKLKGMIANLLDIDFDFETQKSGDRIIVNALREYVRDRGSRGNISLYVQEALRIKNALPQAISIDNFIDAHKDNKKLALCGKLAIVRSILLSERKSLLYFDKVRVDSTIQFKKLEDTWYIPFFQKITENCTKNDLKDRFQSITLIIFNYDRCIEHFLYYAIQNYYGVSGEEATKLIEHINMYHPYGSVGSVPWQMKDSSIEFGADPNSKQLLKLTHEIKTFTEGTSPESSDIIAIRKHMSTNDRIVFMGFAFHELNMQLIKPVYSKSNIFPSKECYATTLEVSESDKDVIYEQINDLYKSEVNIKMSNTTCKKFFTEFWRSLAF